MRTGPVKRATFWLGLTVLLMGVFYLFEPIGLPVPPERVSPEQDEYNCGSAALPKAERVSSDRRVIPEQCRGPLARHRWVGGAAVALGTAAIVRTGPRCLVTPD
jgi:hypothetical protein